MIHEGRVYRARLIAEQEALAVKTAGCCRFVVNRGVDLAPAIPPGNNLPPVGVDRGVNIALATSARQLYDQSFATPGEAKRRLALERRRERQTKGSNRRQRTNRQLAKLRGRERRRREDFLHKVTTNLANNHGLVAIEDLHIPSMTASARGTVEQPGRNVAQKAGLNRAILDKGWGAFTAFLTYKLTRRGGLLVRVPAAYTSQTCIECWHRDAASRVSQAVFCCTACGHRDNADVNAARVILARALELVAAGQAVTAREAESGRTRTTQTATAA